MNVPDSPLEKPPIVEMILNIECDPADEFRIDSLSDDTVAAFLQDYPRREDLVTQSLRVTKQDKELSEELTSRVDGVMFTDTLRKQTVQVRNDGLTFNQLAPYTSFSDYLPSIAKAWDHYAHATGPIVARQVGLRYVNKIDIPYGSSDLIELSDYFETDPTGPRPDKLITFGFYQQSVALDRVTQNQTKFTITDKKGKRDALTVLIDVETYSPVMATFETWDQILTQIESLRDLKNVVFFGAITERCRELFR